MMTLTDSLNTYPDQVAITYIATDADPIILSRAQLRHAIQQTASQLRHLGTQPRDLLIIAHTQNLESIISFWAALWIGAIPTMFPTLTEKLDPQRYFRDLTTLATLSQAKLVLTRDDFAPSLRPLLPCPVIGSLSAQHPAEPLPAYRADPAEIAFLQHSSGTTGLQKGVALSHGAVMRHLNHLSAALKLTPSDVIVSWLPLYHDMGLIAGFLLPLVRGIPLVLMSPFDWVAHPAMLLRALHEYRGTLCWLPNFAYSHMTRRIRERDVWGVRLDHMRAFINCSEPVSAGSHAQFLERFGANGVRADQLAVSYAMAENVFAVTQTVVGEVVGVEWVSRAGLRESLVARIIKEESVDAAPSVSCGVPLAGVEVRIEGEAGEILPMRHVGEIVIRSDTLLTGYYRRDELTPLTADGWYRTGDRGYVNEMGELFVLGRSKELIIHTGKNLYPQDLEGTLNEMEGVKGGRCVIFGMMDEREGTEVLVAVIEVVVGMEDGLRRELMKRVRQGILQAHGVSLAYVSLVDEGWLLKTSSGKIARGANREKWLAERDPHG